MLGKEEIAAIESWLELEDVGGFDQWIDKLQRLNHIIAEHDLKRSEGFMIFLQIAQLYKLCNIRDLLQQIVDNDVGKGGLPNA